ncbi:zinc-finger domain-containing protein [Bacillus cereus]|uniref:zinc-finger domain-containing protein n=1 Tax=Bacillus cereus TaxID=1396 RepID=UPI003D985B41
MNKDEMSIRILDLQDQHCMDCNYHTSVHTYCINDCGIGKEIYQLGTELILTKRTRKEK